MPDAKWKSTLRRKLLKWFDENQRDLPWRKNKTPYRIWVSEIMLQQTQVATVVDYYKRFLKRFPTVKKLAAAQEAEVLKLWEGLGYYRRARQLHAAAKLVVQQHGGKFPTNFDSVLALPGIGRYTAGAILSISQDQQQPILEGNTIRLFARLMEMKSDPRTTSNQKALWEFSQSILPRKRCGDFNQALMELGSEICHPKRPQCLICPIHDLCPTAIKGLQESIPVAAKKIKYQELSEAVVVIKRGNKFLVRQCGTDERWAGLWDFARYEIGHTEKNEAADRNGASTHSSKELSKTTARTRLKLVERVDSARNPTDKLKQAIAKTVKQETGLVVAVEKTGKQIKHAVTKYRITLDCYLADQATGRLKRNSNLKWMTIEQVQAAPMSGTGRKIASWINEKLG